MLGHLFNRQHRPTHHSTVTALQGCLRYPHYRSLSLQSCPDCSPGCPLMFLSFLTTLPYMMTGIHLDVPLYEKAGASFWKKSGRREIAWNILDCLILLLLLRKKILKVEEISLIVWFCCCCCARKYLRCFAPVEEAVLDWIKIANSKLTCQNGVSWTKYTKSGAQFLQYTLYKMHWNIWSWQIQGVPKSVPV